MNCLPGDLARVVGFPPHLGDANNRIVRLKNEPHVNGEWVLEEPLIAWVSGPVISRGRVYMPTDEIRIKGIKDQFLRPIRYLVGEDESLVRTGKPKGDTNV